MDPWFKAIADWKRLSPSDQRALENDGYIVIPGPVPETNLVALANAYDRAILDADPSDVGRGSTTTRVHDLVDRGRQFDDLYVYEPVLEAGCQVIGQPFKLSSLLARTLHPRTPPQKLHVDFAGDDHGWPMLGFIFMVDDFRAENGATCFLPGSQGEKFPNAVLSIQQACGPAGSMILYNGSTWHGHGANVTDSPRRSIQGAYIRRAEESPVNLPGRMRPETRERITPLARYLLAL